MVAGRTIAQEDECELSTSVRAFEKPCRRVKCREGYHRALRSSRRRSQLSQNKILGETPVHSGSARGRARYIGFAHASAAIDHDDNMRAICVGVVSFLDAISAISSPTCYFVAAALVSNVDNPAVSVSPPHLTDTAACSSRFSICRCSRRLRLCACETIETVEVVRTSCEVWLIVRQELWWCERGHFQSVLRGGISSYVADALTAQPARSPVRGRRRAGVAMSRCAPIHACHAAEREGRAAASLACARRRYGSPDMDIHPSIMMLMQYIAVIIMPERFPSHNVCPREA
eukprot:114083-Pleurochrysis_carterae.AAC.2